MTGVRTSSRDGGTVVGIPAHNEEHTVAAVARVADVGLLEACPDEPTHIVLAENGSTDGTVAAFQGAGLRTDSHVVQADDPRAGKGTNVFALVDFALEHGAERLILLDADLRSARPEWVTELARAVDAGEPAMATPVYRRDRYEAGVTNHLVTPLLQGLAGTRVQQPIGGEFAFNRAFMQTMQEWPRPASAYLYGVDIWLTSNALLGDVLVTEVSLGTKLHSTPFENVLHLPQQVTDSLFHVATLRQPSIDGIRSPIAAQHATVSDEEATPQESASVEKVLAITDEYLRQHWDAVHAMFSATRGVRRGERGWRVDSTMWPGILADAVQGIADGAFADSRDHLVALYINRLVTFWSELEGKTATTIDSMLADQVKQSAALVRRSGLAGAPVPARFDRGRWAEFTSP